MMLDLPAAFDTVDNILLTRLAQQLGLLGSQCVRFRSLIEQNFLSYDW